MNAVASTARLLPGFADPVFDSQAVFRGLMSAIAYPGRVVPLDRVAASPAPLNAATTGLCLALADFETPVWLDHTAASAEALAYLRFHGNVPLAVRSDAARFAVVAHPLAMPRLADFNQGEDQYPDRSATLVVQVPALSGGPPTRWSGPGIKGSVTPGIAGLPEWFWAQWALNGELYPRGVDVFFTAGGAVVGLPRTVRVEA